MIRPARIDLGPGLLARLGSRELGARWSADPLQNAPKSIRRLHLSNRAIWRFRPGDNANAGCRCASGWTGLDWLQGPVPSPCVQPSRSPGELAPSRSAPPRPRVASRRRAKPSNARRAARFPNRRTACRRGRSTGRRERDVVLYSPALRYQSYGGGYGRGPYGTVDCGMMYKGM